MEGFEYKNSAELVEKQKLWDEAMEALEQIADKLGKPIDEGIKEAVVAFEVNKFPTRGSCEGHVEERFGKTIKIRPYVEVGLNGPSQRFVGETEIRKSIAGRFGVLPEEIEDNDLAEDAFWDYVQNENISETPEYLEIKTKNEELERELRATLESFYVNRETPEEVKLIVKSIGPSGYCKITTAKENPKEVQESEIEQYKKELSREQEEIKDFVQFLKARFFEQQ